MIKNNTVPLLFQDTIPDKINWSLGKKGTLMKAQIMILDLLATNDWERPVYFAITVGKEHYMNLQDFFSIGRIGL